MPTTDKPSNLKVWAETAPEASLADPAEKTTRGYVANEVPLHEHFNYLLKQITQTAKHNNEWGVNRWDNTTSYPLGAVVIANDKKIYTAVSLLDNVGFDPTSSDKWELGVSARGSLHLVGFSPTTTSPTSPYEIEHEAGVGRDSELTLPPQTPNTRSYLFIFSKIDAVNLGNWHLRVGANTFSEPDWTTVRVGRQVVYGTAFYVFRFTQARIYSTGWRLSFNLSQPSLPVTDLSRDPKFIQQVLRIDGLEASRVDPLPARIVNETYVPASESNEFITTFNTILWDTPAGEWIGGDPSSVKNRASGSVFSTDLQVRGNIGLYTGEHGSGINGRTTIASARSGSPMVVSFRYVPSSLGLRNTALLRFSYREPRDTYGIRGVRTLIAINGAGEILVRPWGGGDASPRSTHNIVFDTSLASGASTTTYAIPATPPTKTLQIEVNELYRGTTRGLAQKVTITLTASAQSVRWTPLLTIGGIGNLQRFEYKYTSNTFTIRATDALAEITYAITAWYDTTTTVRDTIWHKSISVTYFTPPVFVRAGHGVNISLHQKIVYVNGVKYALADVGDNGWLTYDDLKVEVGSKDTDFLQSIYASVHNASVYAEEGTRSPTLDLQDEVKAMSLPLLRNAQNPYAKKIIAHKGRLDFYKDRLIVWEVTSSTSIAFTRNLIRAKITLIGAGGDNTDNPNGGSTRHTNNGGGGGASLEIWYENPNPAPFSLVCSIGRGREYNAGGATTLTIPSTPNPLVLTAGGGKTPPRARQYDNGLGGVATASGSSVNHVRYRRQTGGVGDSLGTGQTARGNDYGHIGGRAFAHSLYGRGAEFTLLTYRPPKNGAILVEALYRVV